MKSTLAAALAALLLAAGTSVAGDEAERFYLEADEAMATDSPFQLRVTFRVRPGEPDDILDAQSGDMKFLDRISRWQLQIYDFYDQKVDYLQGRGAPAADAIAWAAVTREGTLLRDGFYKAIFAWADRAGRMHRTPPVEVALLSPPGLSELVSPQVRVALIDDDLVLRLSEDLTFPRGLWQVKPQSIPVLERIAEFLKKYPKNKLAVEGHADATGSALFNRLLSRQRARAVHNFLIARGIDPGQVTYEGVGSAQPIASNTTEEGRAKNRRVEIILRKATI